MNQTNQIGTVLALHWYLICLSQIDNALVANSYLNCHWQSIGSSKTENPLVANWCWHLHWQSIGSSKTWLIGRMPYIRHATD